MSIQPHRSEGRSPYWGVPIARAIPALIVAAYLTFQENHSPQVGLFVFGAFAVVTGVVIAVLTARVVAPGVNRRLGIAQGVIAAAVGVVALVVNDGGVPFFLYVVSLFGALTGFLELYVGLRNRRSTDQAVRMPAKDHVAAGAFAALLALVFLVVPLDIVSAVGLFGGYAVMLGLYLIIGGLSLRWAAEPPETPGQAAPLNQESTL